MEYNKELLEMTDKELIKTIESQNTWNSLEFEELLRRADIDQAAAPYVIDGESQKDPEEIYLEARTKVLGGMEKWNSRQQKKQ